MYVLIKGERRKNEMDTMKIGDFKIESGKIEFVCQFNGG